MVAAEIVLIVLGLVMVIASFYITEITVMTLNLVMTQDSVIIR